jgi:hypothetical protein
LCAVARQGVRPAGVTTGGHSIPRLSVLLSVRCLSVGLSFGLACVVVVALGSAHFRSLLVIVFAFRALVDCNCSLREVSSNAFWLMAVKKKRDVFTTF